MLTVKKVKRARYAHQVSLAAFYSLLDEAFQHANNDGCLDSWIANWIKNSVQFCYWFTGMELESLLLILVRSLQAGNFQMFLSDIEQIIPWMFALDHTHYSRWLPIFLQDMKILPAKHPFIYDKFSKGHVTVQKSGRTFSSMEEDQAHEQNNKLVKIDAGAIDILDSPAALMKWMVSGPYIASMLSEFTEEHSDSSDLLHHEDTQSFEVKFRKVVQSLLNV